MSIPFTLSNLKQFGARINADPSMVEGDGRRVFTETFALEEQRCAVVDALEAEVMLLRRLDEPALLLEAQPLRANSDWNVRK